MFVGARNTLLVMVSLVCALLVPSVIVHAQSAIRVETSQVLVPVVVFDRQRVRAINKNNRSLFNAVLPGEVDAIISSLMVHGLTGSDFRVFDDNKEQPIQKVTVEQTFYWDMRDNRGHHTEYIGPGGGKWSTAEWGPGVIGDVDVPQHYVISYNLPQSPEGSCHHVKVTVNRPNVLVAARPDYCNTKHLPSDVLSGTKLGLEMEDQLLAPQNKFSLAGTANALFAGSTSEAVRVHIALDWPWRLFEGQLETVGVLGMIVTVDGRLVTRFSDTASREEGIPYGAAIIFNGPKPTSYDEERYENELALPSGQYEVRAVVGNGKRFASSRFPLIVTPFDQKNFDVSTIVLCKQVDDVSAHGHTSVLPGAWKAEPSSPYVPLVSNGLEFKPTSNARFKKGATLYLYFEVFDPFLTTNLEVQFQIRIADPKTGNILSDPQPVSASPYIKAGDPVIPIGRGIDISKLSSGEYRVDVSATNPAGRSTPWRSATFSVQ